MDSREILGFCLKKGLLIDKEVLNLFSGTTDTESVKLIIEKIKTHTNQRIITKNVFYNNQNQIEEFFSSIPEEKIKKLKVKLGLSIEISGEIKKPIQEYEQMPVWVILKLAEQPGELRSEELDRNRRRNDRSRDTPASSTAGRYESSETARYD